MKITVFFAVFLSVFVLFSCKSKQQSTAVNVAKKTNEKTLVIEFYSKGGGIDHSSRKMLDSLLVSKTDIDCEFNKVINAYGREGEREYCLKFQDNRCYNKTYAVIVTKLGDKKLVRIHPNGTCRK